MPLSPTIPAHARLAVGDNAQLRPQDVAELLDALYRIRAVDNAASAALTDRLRVAAMSRIAGEAIRNLLRKTA